MWDARYVNPKGEPRRWDKHLVVPAYQTEIGLLRDVDGDGRPEIVYGAEGQLRYAKPIPQTRPGPGSFATSRNAATRPRMDLALET